MSSAGPAAAGTLPMRRALNRALAVVAGLAISVSLVAVLATGILLLRDYARQNLELIARQAAYTVEVAVVFNDAMAVEQAVQPLFDSAMLTSVEVYDARGQLLYAGTCGASCAASALGTRFEPAAVSVPIRTSGTPLGTVTVHGPTNGIGTLLVASLIGAVVALLLVFAATRLVRRQLERTIIRPLQEIAKAAHGVRNERSFERRAPRAQIVEVDDLSNDFNALLDELNNWQQQVAQAHDVLVQRANFDPLSGLPNRASFIEQVRDAIKASQRTGDRFAILFMDGDGFKETNDHFGHAAGDIVIAQIAARLGPILRVGDVASRVGGDEFAALIHHLEDDCAALAVADRITEAMLQPIVIGEHDAVTVGLSIGMAVYPEDGTDVDVLMNHADAAMYAAKSARKAGI